jgi:peptidoglycan/LPS O-acetylase OafA/YrhL
MQSPQSNTAVSLQIDSLNGLRGLAAIVVVLSHASIAEYNPLPSADFSGNGKAGVYLFFLLSSFLLSRPFFARGLPSYTGPKLRQYWKRRFLRIYPLYTAYILFFGMATYVGTNIVGYDLGAFSFSPREVLRQLLLLEGRGLTWTIIVEFKFYLLLPFITYLAIHLQKRAAPIFVILLFLGLIFLSLIAFPPASVKNNDLSLSGYLYIFLLGTLMGWLDINFSISIQKHLSGKVSTYIGLIGTTMIFVLTPSIYSFIFHSVSYDYFHTRPLPHVLAWFFVLIAVIYGSGLLNKIMLSQFLTHMGTISFSIYLLHSPIISFARRGGLSGVGGFWFVALVTVVVSILSYRLIEKPASRIR